MLTIRNPVPHSRISRQTGKKNNKLTERVGEEVGKRVAAVAGKSNRRAEQEGDRLVGVWAGASAAGRSNTVVADKSAPADRKCTEVAGNRIAGDIAAGRPISSSSCDDAYLPHPPNRPSGGCRQARSEK